MQAVVTAVPVKVSFALWNVKMDVILFNISLVTEKGEINVVVSRIATVRGLLAKVVNFASVLSNVSTPSEGIEA